MVLVRRQTDVRTFSFSPNVLRGRLAAVANSRVTKRNPALVVPRDHADRFWTVRDVTLRDARPQAPQPESAVRGAEV